MLDDSRYAEPDAEKFIMSPPLRKPADEDALLERGIDNRPRSYYGTYLGALIYADRRSLLFT